MIRKKSLWLEANPKYGECEVWYTLKLNHGGMTLNDAGNLLYLGGSTSVFDYINGKRWSMSYLSELCEGLGYMDEKKFYSGSEGNLIALETDEHASDVKKTAYRSREFTIWLESKKNAVGILEALEEDGVGQRVGSDVGVEHRDISDIGGVHRDGSNVEHGDGSKFGDLYRKCRDVSAVGFEQTCDVADEYNSEEDENYCPSENSCDGIIDSILFDEAVGLEKEWGGLTANDKKKDDNDNSSSSDELSEAADEDESDFNSIATDVDEDDTINELIVSSHGRSFLLGQKFSTKAQFKEDVNSYAIRVGRPTSFVKNDKRRIYAKCDKVDEGCGWHITALAVKDEASFQIRKMDLTHTCARQLKVSNANSTWLANRFEQSFRCEPNRTASGFRKSAMTELGVFISPQQAFRTRQKALAMIEGSSTDQYSRLWDYASILNKKNPGSTILLQLDNTPTGKAFKSFYVCLDATKRGFRSGCRPWIGVDGCHLSGPNAGVLLSAVAMDPNNCPFPIAYAVVTVENKETWEWFLRLLRDDLLCEREEVYTFMSDKQKGLIAAFENILPTVENRFCVLHLHGNMKRAGFRGDQFKKLLWKTAHSTTVGRFSAVMEEIKNADANLFAWLQSKPAREWSKSHFTTFGKCDTLVNNMCEQFNKCILDARDKPILTMLEWIRQYIMLRMQKNRDDAERKWEGRLLCENIVKIINNSVKASGDCIPMKSTARKYEVLSTDGSRCAVNLDSKSCDCRRWELSGIPCKHAASAIAAAGEKVENYVHKCYHVDTYMSVYAHAITPMGGQEVWEKTGFIPPMPPAMLKKKKGRTSKTRKKSVVESPKKKPTRHIQALPKQKFKVKCRYCGEPGHNIVGCAMRKEREASTTNVDKSAKSPKTKTTSDDVCKLCLEVGHSREDCDLRKIVEDEINKEQGDDGGNLNMEAGDVGREGGNLNMEAGDVGRDGGNLNVEAEELNFTQPDFNETQEEVNADGVGLNNAKAVNKPTTRKGRKLLAKKRIGAATSKKRKTINKETNTGEAYSISSAVQEKVPEAEQPTPIDPNFMKFRSTG